MEVGDLCEVAAREELSIFAFDEVDEAFFLLSLSFAHLSSFLERCVPKGLAELNPHKRTVFSDALLHPAKLRRMPVNVLYEVLVAHFGNGKLLVLQQAERMGPRVPTEFVRLDSGVNIANQKSLSTTLYIHYRQQ